MTVRVNRTNILRNGRVFDITLENVTFDNDFTVDLEIIRHPGASAIVPLTQDGRVVMLKQYRHAIGAYIWEIPAGTFNGQEDPLVCARRELTEETGYRAETWERLGSVTPVPGYSDERIQIYLARELTPASQHLDKDEFLEVHTIPLTHVVQMIVAGEIQDAKTVMGIFLTLSKMNQMGIDTK